MTDEAQAAPACELCGAAAHEECEDWCEGFTVQHAVVTTSWEESQARLMAAVHRLPMNRFAGDVPQRDCYEVEEWMSLLADWMTIYQSMLTEQVTKLEADSKRAIGLQIEKDVVRSFLGVS